MATSPPAKPSVRDILLSLALLVPVVLLIAGLNRACAFSPTGPTVDTGQLPVVDAPDRLRDAAQRSTFPLRVPAVPPGWRANSANERALGGGRMVEVGWITEAGRYLRLVQSDAAEDALLAALTTGEATGGPAVGQGSTDVAGTRWVIYRAAEPVWVADAGGVRLLISGSGSEDEFRALAGGTTSGQLLPVPR